MTPFPFPQRCSKCKEVMTVEPDGVCLICKGTDKKAYDVYVDFYKDSGKWYSGGKVEGITSKPHNVDDIVKEVYEKQRIVSNPKNFTMVVRETAEIEGGFVNFIVFQKLKLNETGKVFVCAMCGAPRKINLPKSSGDNTTSYEDGYGGPPIY